MALTKVFRPSPSAPGKELPDVPAAHATDDKTYLLRAVVTGADTAGGSTTVLSWVVDTSYVNA